MACPCRPGGLFFRLRELDILGTHLGTRSNIMSFVLPDRATRVVAALSPFATKTLDTTEESNSRAVR